MVAVVRQTGLRTMDLDEKLERVNERQVLCMCNAVLLLSLQMTYEAVEKHGKSCRTQYAKHGFQPQRILPETFTENRDKVPQKYYES